MALKDILIHMDSSQSCPARLEAAIHLARSHEAHLVGVYVITHVRIPSYVETQIPASILEAQTRIHREEAAKAESAFRTAADKAGVSYEWRGGEGELVEVLNVHARYCDVVMVGQRQPQEAGSDYPDRLILSIGRPALVIPYAGKYAKIGERVMVAWDASRLATRAVHDALTFLTRAKQVDVIAINPKSSPEGHGAIPSADICAHLARHGIKAEAHHSYADDMDAGEVLLSRAADRGSDLLVMGAYGHARWRELVLGGLTNFVLKHMTVPVLMSH